MGEISDGQPIFPGESEVDQLYIVQRIIGMSISIYAVFCWVMQMCWVGTAHVCLYLSVRRY